MIPRTLAKEMLMLSGQYPVVTVLGPRQSGKSTLVKYLFPEKTYVNLEAPDERRMIEQDPRSFLSRISAAGAIIDEVQRFPDLLSYIQVHVDTHNHNGQFILTGSHQLELHQAITQSLAGRTAVLTLLPFSISELKSLNLAFDAEDYLFQGFFPKLYRQKMNPSRYYQDYVSTYLERDVRRMINIKDLGLFQDFLYLIAGRIGQLINYNNISNDLGVSNHTVKQWISILEASYILFKIRPYFENIGKRIVKSSKIYFTDPGLACYLLGIENATQLHRSPFKGPLFENMVVLECLKARYHHGKVPNLYFYRDNHQHEVDLLIKNGTDLIPVEIKSSKTFHPEFLKGLKYIDSLLSDQITKGYVIYAGNQSYQVGKFKSVHFSEAGDLAKAP